MNKLFKESNQEINEVKEVTINVFGEPIVFQYTVEEMENKVLPNNKLNGILKPLFESFGIEIYPEKKARDLKIKHINSRIEDIKLNIKVLGAKDGIELYEESYGADIISKKAREKFESKLQNKKTVDYKEAMRKVFGENITFSYVDSENVKNKLKEQKKELAEIERSVATVNVTINGETKTLPVPKKLPKVNPLKKSSKVKEKKINVMVDSKSYKGAGDAFKDKVLKKNAGAITDRIALKIVTVKELIKYASNGHAIRPAIFNKVGNELSDNFKGIQAFFIDVDEENSINDSLRIAKENNINVAAIVPTVRFTVENQKHRIVLILDKPILDERIAKQLITELIQLFHADKQCKNLKRFYFGSCNKPLHVDYNAINNVENLIKITKIAETKTAEIVDMTNLEVDNNSEFETTHILNLYNNIYKINKGGESNNLYEDGSKLDKSMLDRLFEDEFFVKTYGFKSFNNMEEIKKYLKAIPLEHLLQIENPSSFNCILHEDNNPSAAIKMIDNVSIYSCFSDGCIGTSNDIFNIVSYVLYKTTDRFMDAFSYIITALNITVKDVDLDFYKRIIEVIKNNRYLALTSNNLGEEFKNVKRKLNSKYTNMLLRTLMDIAEYTLDCCPQINKAEDLIFTASSSFLQDKAGFSSKKMIQERIDDLVAIGFIEQLTDQEVKNININVYNSINALQKKNFYGKTKTINCYRLKRVDTKALAEAEELFKYSKQIGATRKGTSALQNNIVGIEARKKESGSFAGKNKNMFEKLRGWFHRTYKRNKYILKHAYLSYASKNNIGEKKASQFLSYLNSELGLSKKVVSKDLINKLKIPTTNIRKTVFI